MHDIIAMQAPMPQRRDTLFRSLPAIVPPDERNYLEAVEAVGHDDNSDDATIAWTEEGFDEPQYQAGKTSSAAHRCTVRRHLPIVDNVD